MMKIGSAVIAVLLLLIPLVGSAEEAEGWSFRFSPYAWLLGVSGDMTVNGITTDMDTSISESLENMRFAGMGRFEAWNGDWGLTMDGLYSDSKADDTFNSAVGPVTLTTWSELLIVEFGGGYRLGTVPLGEEAGTAAIVFEVLAGGRYAYNKNKLKGSLGLLDTSGSGDWVAPYIGGRVGIRVDKRWSFILWGDIGGFGIGDAPHFIWNAMAVVDFRVSRVISLDLAYRSLDINGSIIDARYYGPALGATFHF